MSTRPPMELDEWYHCYNRGVDKRKIFSSQADYQRFLAIVFLSNGTKKVRLSDRYDTSLAGVLADSSIDRGNPLVDIGVYALMPNHIHFILRQIRKGGIATFMHRISTAYTMYFNKKNNRTGSLFSGVFKSKHIGDDRYLKQVVAYVLLNPAEVFEPKWKKGKADASFLERKLLSYPYASLSDFFGAKRAESVIVGASLHEFYDQQPTLRMLLKESQSYYAERSMF